VLRLAAAAAAVAPAGITLLLLLVTSPLQLAAAARYPLAVNASTAEPAAAAAGSSQPQFDSVFTAAISLNETKRIREAFTAIGSKGLSPELVRFIVSCYFVVTYVL
jgi:hypothetical protein